MDVIIREGKVPDSAACWGIYSRAVREGAAPHYTEAQRRAWAPEDSEPAWIAARLAESRTWIAERGGVPVGFLTVTGPERGGAMHLDLFFVLPDMRRTGVADALYAAFEREAAADEGAPPRLTAYASLMLRPFLERRGWRVLVEEWAERGGVKLNRFAMEKPGAGS